MNKMYVLTDVQVAIIKHNFKTEKTQVKAMSVLAYLTRLFNKGGVIYKTYKDLFQMHQKSKSRVRLSLTTFKELMKILKDSNLILTDNSSKNSKHWYEINQNPTEKSTNKKDGRAVENTNVTANNKIHSTLRDNNIYNNNFTANSNFGKTLEFEEGQNLVENLLKSMKIKSEFVKQLAFLKVGKVFNKINIAGAEAYIIKLIQDLINENRIRFQYRQKQFNMHYNKQNCGKFNQQVAGFREKNYDYDALERELLGWD